ncbi:unnamed protein product [Discosporangium mesarthrocarpum]
MPSGAWIYLREVFPRRPNIFRVSLGQDPPAKVEPMRVVLKAGATPVKAKPRDYKPGRRSWLAGFVAVLVVLRLLIWVPQAIWSSPAMPIPKPGRRGYRLVTDYSSIISRAERSPSPMSNMEAMMAAITGAGCFAKLDLFTGNFRYRGRDRRSILW